MSRLDEVVERNAIISGAEIDIGERGVLDCWLSLDYGDCGAQGFGGYALYLPKGYRHHHLESCAGHFIFRVLEVAGATKWKDLLGKTIRVRASHSKVEAIGHIVKDDWFCPAIDLKKPERAP